MKKDNNVIFEKTEKELIEESLIIINNVFGQGSDDGLNEYKRLSIYNVYKEFYETQGLQKHHYEEIIETIKPLIIQLEDVAIIEDTIRKAIDIFKKQKWNSIFAKLEAYRNS